MKTSSLPSAQPRLNGPALTPEAAEQLRVLLEAFCALLTAIFPFKSMVERRMAPVWDWLDRAQVGEPIAPVAEDCAEPEVAVIAPALEQIVAVVADGATASVKVMQSSRRARAPSTSCSDVEDRVATRRAMQVFGRRGRVNIRVIGVVSRAVREAKNFAKKPIRDVLKVCDNFVTLSK